MKNYTYSKILLPLSKLFFALIFAAGMTACDSVIYDYEEDCDPDIDNPNPRPDRPKPDTPNDPDPDPEPEPDPTAYYVEYVFDMNMQFVDAFTEKVNSVDLYVFSKSGAFIKKYHEDGAALSDKNYRMNVTDLPAGSYEMIAWCGLTNNDGDFTVPAESTITQRHQIACTMATLNDGDLLYQKKNLKALFHGKIENATYTTDPGDQVCTVYLTKNTNNINLTLQHKDGLEFDKDRFNVTLTDNNGYMRYDNGVPDSNDYVEYRPYRTAIGTATSGNTSRATGTTTGNYLQVELSTARLMKDHNPVITVTDTETGKDIFSIPIIKWALQLRSSNYKDMDDQEFLDREDNYNLMLWLDNDEEGWFGAEINILDWHVVDDSEAIK